MHLLRENKMWEGDIWVLRQNDWVILLPVGVLL